MNSSSSVLSGLAASLVHRRLLDEKTAIGALEQSRKHQTPFVTHLVQRQLVQGIDIARLASQEFNLPLLDIDAISLESAPITLVKGDLILRHHALPLQKRGNHLFLGLADPTHLPTLEDIKFQTGLQIEPVIAVEPQLTKAIESMLNKPSVSVPHLPQQDPGSEGVVTYSAPTENYSTNGDDSSIKRFVNRTLLDAVHRGASDVHFEPYEKNFRVRFRQDGVLHEIVTPPTSMASRIVARVKVMARLNLAEHRIPQDGGMRMQLSPQQAIDFRVNILPTSFGEKVVLRILDPGSARLGIDVLGYEPRQKDLFLRAIHKSQGMVLVTGPTGSGKTVSMYTALNILNTPEVNISTVEDPVEINLSGINQVNVNPKTGMTFANALRAFLRQDPDIIMVGEIRDLETAEIAIKAAQTGHMVLSTLHTNNAPQTLTRLMNMGVAPYNIASSVTLIVAQRLARRLCNHCKTQDPVPPEELLNQGFMENDLNDLTVFRAVGCGQCTLGYKGRIGIYEVMPISAKTSHLIMAGGNALELAEQARREGIESLRQSGLRKVRAGLVSLEELNRVTKD